MAQVPKVRRCDLPNRNKSLPDPTIVSNLPDLLSPHFNGREDVLKRIRDSFALNYGGYIACCAIYGCSGLSKTQVALKYALDAYNSSICHVFWICAASIEKLDHDFGIIAETAEICKANVPSQRFSEIRRWLETAANGRWLLVIDNVVRGSEGRLRELLPQMNRNGCLLFTTRTKEVAESLATAYGNRVALVALQPLKNDDALKIFSSRVKLGTSVDPDTLGKIIETLDRLKGLPLAIEQAASFLAVGLFAEMHNRMEDLLESNMWLKWASDQSRYEETSLGPIVNYAVEKLHYKYPDAVKLLYVISLLGPEGIPLGVLRDGALQILDPPDQPKNNKSAENNRVNRNSEDNSGGKAIEDQKHGGDDENDAGDKRTQGKMKSY